jgi:hypothetical protein
MKIFEIFLSRDIIAIRLIIIIMHSKTQTIYQYYSWFIISNLIEKIHDFFFFFTMC